MLRRGAVCVLCGVLVGCATPGGGQQLKQARRLMEQGQLVQACSALDSLVSRDDSNRQDQLELVRTWVDCLVRSGELSRAAVRLAPMPEAVRMYGAALVQVGRDPRGMPRALQLLRRAQTRWPDEAEIPYRAAVLLLADGQAGAALPFLDRAGRLQDSASVAVARAHALLDLGRTREALDQVRQVPTLRPSTRDVQRGRALIQRIARRGRAIPPSARRPYRQALDLLRRRDLAGECVRKVEAMLLDHPRLAAAHTLLGLAHLRLGNVAEAVVALRRAETLNALDATNPLYLAVVYQKRGQVEQSISSYQKALSLDPFLLQAGRELGQLLLRQGRGPAAADVLERVAVLDQESDSSQRMAGRAHMAAGALRRAERYFVHLARSNPDDFELNLRLGQLLLRRYKEEGRVELLQQASRHIRRAASTHPSDPEVEELQLQLRQVEEKRF